MRDSSTTGIDFSIHISAKQIRRYLVIITVCLCLTGTLSAYFILSDFQFPKSQWFYNVFSLERELNIPSWYSSFMLLFSSGLLAVITSIKKKDKYFVYWKSLSLIFLLMSMDEAFSFHELLIIPSLREELNLSPVFYHTWVIFGIPAVIFFAFKYFKFFRDLPKKSQSLFLLAATFYVGGALGMEMVSGILIKYLRWTAVLGVVIEESLEMIGIVTFIYALLAYLSSLKEMMDIKLYISDE